MRYSPEEWSQPVPFEPPSVSEMFSKTENGHFEVPDSGDEKLQRLGDIMADAEIANEKGFRLRYSMVVTYYKRYVAILREYLFSFDDEVFFYDLYSSTHIALNNAAKTYDCRKTNIPLEKYCLSFVRKVFIELLQRNYFGGHWTHDAIKILPHYLRASECFSVSQNGDVCIDACVKKIMDLCSAGGENGILKITKDRCRLVVKLIIQNLSHAKLLSLHLEDGSCDDTKVGFFDGAYDALDRNELIEIFRTLLNDESVLGGTLSEMIHSSAFRSERNFCVAYLHFIQGVSYREIAKLLPELKYQRVGQICLNLTDYIRTKLFDITNHEDIDW